jgi:acylphosphatase
MAKAKFVMEGEVQNVGFRANLISFASEACILCKIKNFSDNPRKVFVLLEAETPKELQAFYNKVKNDDIRVQTKLKTVIGYKVKDIEWLDHGTRVFSWDEYYSMVQAEAGLKTMAAIKRVEEKIKKLTADEKPPFDSSKFRSNRIS